MLPFYISRDEEYFANFHSVLMEAAEYDNIGKKTK